MAMFKIFQRKSESLDTYLRSLEEQIEQTIISEGCEIELQEFKRFIIVFVVGCLYTHKVLERLGLQELSADDPINKKIFRTVYSHALPFFDSYVLNDRIIIGATNNERYKLNGWTIIDSQIRLQEYRHQIIQSLESKKPFFIEEWEDDDYVEDLDIHINGQKHYFEYLRLLFMTKVEEVNEEIFISQMSIEEIFIEGMESLFDDMDSFVQSLSRVYSQIEITSQMLSNYD